MTEKKIGSFEELVEMFPDHRQCGTCMECCTTMGIPEMKKPAMNPCQFACGGCQIYKDRPYSCKIWACMWWMNLVPEEFSPEKTGLTFCPPESIVQGCAVFVTKAHPEKKHLWHENKPLIDWMRAMTVKMNCMFLIGTYVSEFLIKDGTVYELTEEQKALLRVGKGVQISPDIEIRDSLSPDWLRN